jgi:molybdopterin-biosynthesis enzyme MoeA-like protein
MARIPVGSIPIQNPVGTAPSVLIETAEIVGVTEAMLAPLLNKIVDSNLPDSIYLKTHPGGHTSDNKPKLRVQIISRGKMRTYAKTKRSSFYCL